MSDKWRPEGWINPGDIRSNFYPRNVPYNFEQGYEAGADAMLEALRKKGVRNEKGHHEEWQGDELISWDVEKSGYTVFIPDNEEKNA